MKNYRFGEQRKNIGHDNSKLKNLFQIEITRFFRAKVSEKGQYHEVGTPLAKIIANLNLKSIVVSQTEQSILQGGG
jgi:hypothetical protein